jgi:large subunit ribosomal protein L30
MGKIKITLRRSVIGATERTKLNVKALGLRRIDSSVIQEATPQILGMIKKVSHLVCVEEVK